jgi:hypothetical protein
MTPERLKEIEGRHGDATQGPWHLRGHNIHALIAQGQLIGGVSGPTFPQNGTFIAHSWQDVKDLLEEVRLLQSLLADARDDSEMFRQGYLAGQNVMRKRAAGAVGNYWNESITGSWLASDVILSLKPEPYERRG